MGKVKSVLKDVLIMTAVCVAVDAAVRFVKDHFMIVDDDYDDADFDDCRCNCDSCCERCHSVTYGDDDAAGLDEECASETVEGECNGDCDSCGCHG